MQIVTKMGLLEQVRSKATGTDTLVIHRADAKPVTVDLRKLYTAVPPPGRIPAEAAAA